MRFASFLACIILVLSVPSAAEVLAEFRPSSVQTTYGVASEVEFSTRLVELESGALAHHLPQAMKSFTFAEPVWVIGYATEVLDANGRTPKENYLCHTFFGDQRVMQHPDQELKGIYSDAFTPEVRLPDGFGVAFAANESLHWMPMFNNRADVPVRVRMKVRLTVIRARDLKKPLAPLYANLRSVRTPHLFFVPPGRDERHATFKLPFDARIHFLGTHIHPHGVSIELYNVSRGEQVWKGTRIGGPDGLMQVYSDAAGYRVRAGETYKVISVYRNPEPHDIDAMAGLLLMYSRN